METPPADTPTALARVLYPALATGDRATLDRLLSNDFLGRAAAGLPLGLGGTYDGPDAMRRQFWGAIGRAYDLRAEPSEFLDLPDGRVLVTGRYTGTARSTGRPVDAAFTHTLSFSNGRIGGLDQLTDTHAWWAALSPYEEDEEALTSAATLASSATPASPAASAFPAAAEVPAAATGSPASLAPSATAPPGRPPLSSVTYDVTDGVGRLTLNRPGQANAIDQSVSTDLLTVALLVAADPTLRCLVIAGAGRRFCAGGDLGFLAGEAADQLPTTLTAMIGDYHEALTTLAELPVPVVCAVQGAAAGGGLGLLYVADIVVATQDAKFALGFSQLGLSCDGGNSYFLPRLVGPARAALLMLTNQVLTGPEALACGLVGELVDADRLADRVAELAGALASGPTRGLAQLRRLLRGSWDHSLTEQLAAERAAIAVTSGTPDAREGLAAFVGKRTPSFTGA